MAKHLASLDNLRAHLCEIWSACEDRPHLREQFALRDVGDFRARDSITQRSRFSASVPTASTSGGGTSAITASGSIASTTVTGPSSRRTTRWDTPAGRAGPAAVPGGPGRGRGSSIATRLTSWPAAEALV